MYSLADTLPQQPADVGIVLGAALWGDEPSPALKERLDRAAELYKQHMFPRLIVSGGYDVPNAKLTEAEGMRDYLVNLGVPAKQIVLENKATSTYENVLFSKQLMDRSGWRKAIVITHRYHGLRALEMAKSVGMEDPGLAVMDSKALIMWWHLGRETLAYTKWQWDKLMLQIPVLRGDSVQN